MQLILKYNLSHIQIMGILVSLFFKTANLIIFDVARIGNKILSHSIRGRCNSREIKFNQYLYFLIRLLTMIQVCVLLSSTCRRSYYSLSIFNFGKEAADFKRTINYRLRSNGH